MIEPIRSSQIEQAGAVIARAFQTDPFNEYVIPQQERRLRVFTIVERMMVCFGLRYGSVFVSSAMEGAAVWLTPAKEPFAPYRYFGSGLWKIFLALTPGELSRLVKIDLLCNKLHKTCVPEPYWYLFLLGVEPRLQGKGYGSQLLCHQLGTLDEQDLPCYLDTLNEVNLAFYQRHGFETLAQAEVEPGGPCVWTMVRKPIKAGKRGP